MNPNSIFTSRDRKQPTNPHARKLDVEADLRPVVDFLQGAGMSQAQVAKVRGVVVASGCMAWRCVGARNAGRQPQRSAPCARRVPTNPPTWCAGHCGTPCAAVLLSARPAAALF